MLDVMQIANVSSTLGSIGDKAQYIKNDEARKANPFASKIVAYKMAKVRSAKRCIVDACKLARPLSHLSMRPGVWLLPLNSLWMRGGSL